MNFSELSRLQKIPLDEKVAAAVEVLQEVFSRPDRVVSLAFSGGKDSTVLWHLIRTFFPGERYHVIFGNTTVEFPESLKFARKLGREWSSELVTFHEVLPAQLDHDELKYDAQREVLEYCVDHDLLDQILKPDGKLKTTRTLEQMATPEMMEDFERRGLIWKTGTMKSYNYCCDQYGYPILGKSVCKLVAKRINIDCFLRFSESKSETPETLEYYDLLRHVKTSNHCCEILKKEPSERKQKELGVNIVIKGLMAAESHTRALSFITRGYIYKSHRPQAADFWHVSPLGIWTDDDIWEYIRRNDVPYSSLYDLEYINPAGERKKIKRNGCVGCCTDIAFSDNHMASLRHTHEKLWKHYMTHGLGDELIKLQKYKSNGYNNTINRAWTADDVLDIQPCAFDDLGNHIIQDQLTFSTYDPELDGGQE